MMRFIAILAMVLLPALAQAQPKQVVATCGSGVTLGVGDGANGTINTAGQECVTAAGSGGTVIVTNPGIVGFGTLAVTNASALASTMTLGVNSGTWSTTPAIVDVTNDPASAGILYVCPKGGTCTSANSIAVQVGQSFRFSGPATTMTFIAASTATAQVQF